MGRSMGRTGSEADFWWQERGEWVEPPNQRRGGSSGVRRVTLDDGSTYYVKRQVDHVYRSLRFPRGRPTVMREWLASRQFARLGIRTPDVVFFDLRRQDGHWHALLVTRALDGYVSLQDGLQRGLWNADERRAIYDALVRSLLLLHRTRRKHGHLYPKEVFVDNRGTQPAIALLDLELFRRRLTRRAVAEADLRNLLPLLLPLGLQPDERQRIIDAYRQAGIALREAALGPRMLAS